YCKGQLYVEPACDHDTQPRRRPKRLGLHSGMATFSGFSTELSQHSSEEVLLLPHCGHAPKYCAASNSKLPSKSAPVELEVFSQPRERYWTVPNALITIS